jgi:hypothetical protein
MVVAEDAVLEPESLFHSSPLLVEEKSLLKAGCSSAGGMGGEWPPIRNGVAGFDEVVRVEIEGDREGGFRGAGMGMGGSA